METKHTKEYAELLALRNALVIGEEYYVAGYMEAIKQTAAPELLEALIKINDVIEQELIILKENTDDDHANYIVNLIHKAIKKATT